MKLIVTSLFLVSLFISIQVARGLPPSVVALNNLADSVGYRIVLPGINFDDDNNMTGYYVRYDSVLVMNIYRFKISSDGKIKEVPRVVSSLIGKYDDFKAVMDKAGQSHFIVGCFMDDGCDWDDYYIEDTKGMGISKIASDPPGDLSACRIMSDSIFVAARIANENGCWPDQEGTIKEDYLQIITREPVDTAITVTSLQIRDQLLFPCILEKAPGDQLLVIAQNTWYTRNLSNNQVNRFAVYTIKMEHGHPRFMRFIEIDNSSILAIPNFQSNIYITQPSTLWLGDSLLFYYRCFPVDYYHEDVDDSLRIILFDSNGNQLEWRENPKVNIFYDNVNQIGSREKLISWFVRSGERITKIKFGLISFRDFPEICIDLGEK